MIIIKLTYFRLVECDAETGKPCDFPFYYNGTWHYGCITHDNDGTPWCDVGTGTKESCRSDCPGKQMLTISVIIHPFLDQVYCKTRLQKGKGGYRAPCSFPFYWKGSWHYECITHDNKGKPWCAVDNTGRIADDKNLLDGTDDSTDSSDHWDNCMSDCPGINLVLTK